jgi:hypothetical protein
MAAPYPWFSDIEAALGVAPVGCRSLGGGHGAAVYGLEMADGRRLVAKVGGADAGLALEGYMLGYLAAHSALPVPDVAHAAEGLLVMAWLPDDGRLDGAAQEHAAEVVAALHEVSAEGFGHERDTVIAALPQPNKWTDSWLAFFRDQRLLHMAHLAHAAGRLDDGLYRRLERFAERIDDYLEEPAAPSLLHGDMWGGNVLTSRGRVAGFIDPAIYHGHALPAAGARAAVRRRLRELGRSDPAPHRHLSGSFEQKDKKPRRHRDKEIPGRPRPSTFNSLKSSSRPLITEHENLCASVSLWFVCSSSRLRVRTNARGLCAASARERKQCCSCGCRLFRPTRSHIRGATEIAPRGSEKT